MREGDGLTYSRVYGLPVTFYEYAVYVLQYLVLQYSSAV